MHELVYTDTHVNELSLFTRKRHEFLFGSQYIVEEDRMITEETATRQAYWLCCWKGI
jgi:hypothetical protein